MLALKSKYYYYPCSVYEETQPRRTDLWYYSENVLNSYED